MMLANDLHRRHTAPPLLERLDDEMSARLSTVAEAAPEAVADRIGALDREWDLDRTVELESALMGLVGLVIAVRARPRFPLMPVAVGAAVLLSATRGWYPLLPIFRRLGIRTAREIERERYALKLLRGDFDGVQGDAVTPSGRDAGEYAAGALPPTSTRVQRSTRPETNERIRQQADGRIARLHDAPPAELERHLAALAREWDIERVLQANASTLVVIGSLLGHVVDRRFLLLPAAVLSFFAQHALQGWCPPIPVFRRIGVRTRREIERERMAIKALRGDFDELPSTDAELPARVRAVLAAVDR